MKFTFLKFDIKITSYVVMHVVYNETNYKVCYIGCPKVARKIDLN